MQLPASITPYLEPETLGLDLSPHEPAAPSPLLAVAAAAILVLLVWHDVSQQGPWAGVAGPLDLARTPVSLPVGWVLAGAAAAFGTGALALRSARPLAVPVEPLRRLPVFLGLQGRRVVVVGGGAVAAAKIPALLDAGADVTVIAPEVSAAIDRSQVRVEQRRFEPHDVQGAWFVTAAATPEVNREVRAAADARAVFVNAVDDPANASAYLGGTFARGGVTVAFSTSGDAPALAGLLREGFDAMLPRELDAWLQVARDLRRVQRAAGVPMAARRPALLQALNALYDGPAGDEAGARR